MEQKKVKIFGEEIAVNARVEYIEGYSGHADQEGLMNFIYSFISKPKTYLFGTWRSRITRNI